MLACDICLHVGMSITNSILETMCTPLYAHDDSPDCVNMQAGRSDDTH